MTDKNHYVGTTLPASDYEHIATWLNLRYREGFHNPRFLEAGFESDPKYEPGELRVTIIMSKRERPTYPDRR